MPRRQLSDRRASSEHHTNEALSPSRNRSFCKISVQPTSIFSRPIQMSSLHMLRLARHVPTPICRSLSAVARRLPTIVSPPCIAVNTFSSTTQKLSGDHGEETFEEFTSRYVRGPRTRLCVLNGWECTARRNKDDGEGTWQKENKADI